MKKCPLTSVLLALLPLGVWQCTPSEYKLVDFKKTSWAHMFNQEIPDRNIRYSYQDDTLASRTEVRWSLKERYDSTYTEYEVKRYDDRIDTVETTWDYWNDTLRYVIKTIKTYSLEGVIKKTVNYSLSDTGWVETGYTTYNASGQKTEIVGYGMYHYWYSYDSLGQYIGYRYRYLGTDSYLSIDTVKFSDDRLSAVRTVSKQDDGDSIPIEKRMVLYKLDKHGKILHEEGIDYDTTSYVRFNYSNSYKYNRRGQLLSQTQGSDKTEYRYHRGLKTWELYYKYENDRWQLYRIYRYKYDFRHKLPLERTLRHEYYTVSANNLLRFIEIMTERVDERLVWTYEK